MTMICFASQKGAPGTTMSTLAIAAAWPNPADRRKLIVEADRSGGVLALRYGLGLEPGFITLAVAVRTGLGGEAVWDHAQELPGGLAAIVGPDSPHRASSVLATVGSSLAKWLGALTDIDVFVDLGRLDADGTQNSFVRHSDLTLMVARPTVEQLQPSAQRMQVLATEQSQVEWLLVGDHPYPPAEVEKAFGYPVAGVISHDRRGAAAFEQGASGTRLRRSGLARSAAAVADSLADRLNPSNDLGPADQLLAELVPAGTSEANGASDDR